MLSRFLQAKKEETAKPKARRPFLAHNCRDLSDADKWRQQILREIGKKVMEIQNPGLGEHRLRDLNDEINKLIREKGHWEHRILELGGPNYAKNAPKVMDIEGNEVQASGKGLGYKYFGAAKELPGVKELFEAPAVPKRRRNRYEMYKRIDADYYGYRDEEDGVLIKLEKKAEREAIDKAVREWQKVEKVKEEARKTVKSGEVVEVRPITMTEEDEPDEIDDDVGTRGGDEGEVMDAFIAHVPLPDEKAIEQMVLKKKKAELLKQYASELLVEEEKEAKSLLNIHR